MNILIINQYASTPKYSTGAGERFYYFLPYFKEYGYESTVLSGGYNHLLFNFPSSDKLFNREFVPGGIFIWVRLRKYNENSFLGRLVSWFEFLVKLFTFSINSVHPPSIVVVSSMSLFPIIYAFWLKKLFKSKVILEIRDIWPLTPVQLGGYSPRHPFILLMSWLEKKAYKNADYLISVLPGFHIHADNIVGFKKPFSWIPNGIHLVDHKKIKYKCNYSSTFRVMYTGALGIANAMEFVILAAMKIQEYRDIKICIVGDGPARPELEKLVKDNNLDNVKFVNKVPKDQIIQMLNDTDVCVISWRNKSIYQYGVSANKYNDYMLAGKPIISASNVKDDPVQIANCGIQVKAESPQAIVEAILKLRNMSIKEREVLGTNGRNYVMENQTMEKLAKKYISVFKEILNAQIL